ncbi:hypothetical protein [Nocardia brevicatena]|uniref:hypothetical protein n=1 Tax=Nocardia brevicatena TaxID=37327 RepID=UPI0002FAE197|nr:hypothetical protein [Nocardia brevicatena]
MTHPHPAPSIGRAVRCPSDARAVYEHHTGPGATPADYSALEWSHSIIRSRYRMEMEMALSQLIPVVLREGGELAVLSAVDSFAAYVARMDAALRRDLAGDRWTDTGRAAGTDKTKGGAAA